METLLSFFFLNKMYSFPGRSEQCRYVEEYGVISKCTMLDLTFNYKQQFRVTIKYRSNTSHLPVNKTCFTVTCSMLKTFP